MREMTSLKSIDLFIDCRNNERSTEFFNRLRLNDSKTKFIIFGSKSKLLSIKTTSVRVEENIKAAKQVRNIGAFFASELKMNTQINNMCKSAWFHLYNISKIQHYLSQDQTKSIVHAYVTSKLDSNNSLQAGITLDQRRRLERVQHAAARLITRSNKYDHVTPLLCEQHWLPIEYRTKFKILLHNVTVLDMCGVSNSQNPNVLYQTNLLINRR